jgi:hypothetical protein
LEKTEGLFLKDIKAMIVQMPYEVDLHNVIQVARAEGVKLFKEKTGKIKVVDVLKWYPHGWIVVVQNGERSISESLKMSE